jgi:glutaredoxin 3
MAKVLMYSTGVCPFCVMASTCSSRGVADIEKVRVDLDPPRRREMEERTARRTVESTWATATWAASTTSALDRAGGLDPLLAATENNDSNHGITSEAP